MAFMTVLRNAINLASSRDGTEDLRPVAVICFCLAVFTLLSKSRLIVSREERMTLSCHGKILKTITSCKFLLHLYVFPQQAMLLVTER